MLHLIMLEHQIKRRQEERIREAANQRLLHSASRPLEATLARISRLAERRADANADRSSEHSSSMPDDSRQIPA